MTPSSPAERRTALFAWLAVCLIWGTTYLAIRVSVETIPPWLMSGIRWVTAGSAIATFMTLRGERVFSAEHWRGATFLGFFMFVLGNGCVVLAEVFVPSGLAAVIVASAPFWMSGVEALRKDGERITRRTVLGFVVGFSGVVLLIWPDLFQGGASGRAFVLGVISLQVACLGWAIGSSYSKRHAREANVFSSAALQMILGGVMMLVIATVLGEWRAVTAFSTRSAIAFGYLTTVGALGGFVAYTYALRHLPVSLVSLYAYVNPIIAVTLGVVILGEPFSMRMALAAALVFGGVAIVRMRGQTRRPLINRTRKSTMAMTSST
jgi:drug/metabolite transporter (DMT)-like permease